MWQRYLGFKVALDYPPAHGRCILIVYCGYPVNRFMDLMLWDSMKIGSEDPGVRCGEKGDEGTK